MAVAMSENLHLDLNPVKDAITPLYGALGHFGNFSGVPNPDPNTSGVMPILPDNISTQAVRGSLLEGLGKIESAEWDKMIQKKQFASLSAGVVLPIYTGGKITAANHAAKIETHEAELELTKVESELLVNVVDQYYGLVLSNELLQVRKDVFTTMQKHFDEANKLQAEGIIAQAELLHAKVYLADATRELHKAEQQLDIVQQALRATLNLDAETTITPRSKLFYLTDIDPISVFLGDIKAESPLLALVESKQHLAEENIRLHKSEFLPTVVLMGNVNIVNKDLSPYMPDMMVGVAINWTLFDGLANVNKYKASQQKKIQAENAYVSVSHDLETAVTKYYKEQDMYRNQIQELGDSRKFADEYFRSQEKAFAEGMATSTQIADAGLLVAKARIEQLSAMYEYQKSLVRLLMYAGKSASFATYASGANAKGIE
jgi:outer membrane protein TolC